MSPIFRAFLWITLFFSPICAGCAAEVLKGELATAEKNEQAVRVELEESQQRLAALGIENQRLLEQRAILDGERAKSAERIAALTAQITDINTRFAAERAGLTAENLRLSEENRLAQERIAFQNASLTRTPTEIIIPNRGERDRPLDFGDPEILPPRRVGETITVELQDRLLFNPDDGKLTQEGEKRLAVVARTLLAQRANGRLRIDSHTAPGADSNSGHGRSFEKGKKVFDFLVGGRIVPVERLSLAASGVSSPILAASVEAAASRNSRIELILE